MAFNRLMVFASVVTIVFASYLLVYGGYALWEYHRLGLSEAIERDAHGMSRTVGYSFIVMLGTMILGIGVIAWLTRNIREDTARKSITVGFTILNSLALIISLVLMKAHWRSSWGNFYVLVFAILAVAFAHHSLVSRRAES